MLAFPAMSDEEGNSVDCDEETGDNKRQKLVDLPRSPPAPPQPTTKELARASYREFLDIWNSIPNSILPVVWHRPMFPWSDRRPKLGGNLQWPARRDSIMALFRAKNLGWPRIHMELQEQASLRKKEHHEIDKNLAAFEDMTTGPMSGAHSPGNDDQGNNIILTI